MPEESIEGGVGGAQTDMILGNTEDENCEAGRENETGAQSDGS